MFLSWIDYAVFSALLIFSFGIGIYQGCFKSKRMTNNEFLIANGEMKIFPTALSLLASLMSAAALLGVPLEIYSFGTMYIYWIFPYFIGTFLTVRLFIPVFRRMESYSIYAYFEKRFSLTVRLFVTTLFVFFHVIYLGVVLYGPSLAVSQVTGLNIWFAIVSCGFICTIYTSIGGMKAVIWSDVLQTVVMFSGVIGAIIFGFSESGGFREIFRILSEGNRIELINFSLNPTVRYTFWSVVLGGSCNAVSVYACFQTQAQRYLCVKSTRSAQKVAWTNFVLCSLMLFLLTAIGGLVYAKYSTCDPLRAGKIKKPDQIFPFFVVEIFSRIPGLTGIFVSAILSASLSTISSGVNSISALLFEDFFLRIFNGNSIEEKKKVFLSKFLSFFVGLLVVFLSFVASFLHENLLVFVFQICGAFGAPIFGLYLLGFFAPRVNARNVLFALSFCFVFQFWLLIGANSTASKSKVQTGRLPTSIVGCSPPLNVTKIDSNFIENSNPLIFLYSMSFYWYGFNSVVIVVLVALLCSFIFGGNDPESVDRNLLVSWKTIFFNNRPETKKSRNVETNQEELVELNSKI